jgi:c-di-GMP-binding flagellar brake protein YcgR
MRRKYRRIPLKGDEIRAETVTETSAQVADLSMGGLGVKAAKRLMPGRPCMITMGANGSLMILRGTTVWERFAGWSVTPRGHKDPLYSAGIRLEESRRDMMSQALGAECDRTRAVRVQAPDLKVLLSFTESLTVLNLSFGGLLAESWNPMEPGTESSTRIFLPDLPEPVKCLARVTSCEPVKSGAGKKYHIGFEFVDMDPAQTERLRTFVIIRSAI